MAAEITVNCADYVNLGHKGEDDEKAHEEAPAKRSVSLF